MDTIESLKHQILQLKELHAAGVLSDSAFEESKLALERRLLDLVLSSTPAPAASPAPAAETSAPPATAQQALVKTAPAAAPATTPAAPAGARPSWRLWAGLGAAVLVLAIAGYAWTGSLGEVLAGGNGAAGAQQTDGNGAAGGPGAAPHATSSDQIAAMVDKLAQRLKDKPDDAEGWSMLARSYNVLGRNADALAAYEKALKLRKDDPVLLADYADTLAVKANGSLQGEPMKLVERALKIDPNNIKALALAGTGAFERQDYATAAKLWEKLITTGPANHPLVQQMGAALDEARRRAGLPPRAQPLDAAPAQAAPAAPLSPSKPATAGGASVSGTITLSAALRGKVQPEDTVFVFARAAGGGRMPLAILRKQVKDLPLQFTLDDSLAMSPANALSGAKQVVVSARVSKSGNAMPQPGDFTGQTDTVSVGASGLRIEIRDAVKP
jgi:cytochrome c-type biogenesis protein CcmH